MAVATETPSATSATTAHADRAGSPLNRNELVLVVVFWTFMAVLTAANRLLDPRGAGFRVVPSSAFVALAFVESYAWALLTPLIFWLASRVRLERPTRVRHITLFLLIGVIVALVVDTTMDAARMALLPPPPRPRGGARGFTFGVPRLWTLNEFVIYLGVLAAGLARDFSLRYRARQRDAIRLQTEAAELHAQLAEARLDALRRQLDPHFLFNTLNAISSLVERNPRGVRQMISRLGDLLRHSMESSRDQEIELSRELELLDRYLDIMRIRFQGRLQVQRRIDDALGDALVPNLVLQPIVENAIRHGVARVEGPGCIDIAATHDDATLVIRVRDNGPGIDVEPSSEQTSGGVGVRNTVTRLEQLYGGAASFELRPADADGGTVAELRIPYHLRTAD